MIHEQNLIAATITALPSIRSNENTIDKLCNETSNKNEALKQVAETKQLNACIIILTSASYQAKEGI